MDMLNKKQKIVVIGLIIIAIGIIVIQYFNSTKEIYTYEDNLNVIEVDEEQRILEKEEKIVIHVTGAVKKEGIVELKEKARINDVIEAAGGTTENADLTDVNLAYIVEDGQKIYIPNKEDKNLTEKINEGENQKEIISDKVGENILNVGNNEKGNLTNINKASLEQLKLLPGVRRINCTKNT